MWGPPTKLKSNQKQLRTEEGSKQCKSREGSKDLVLLTKLTRAKTEQVTEEKVKMICQRYIQTRIKSEAQCLGAQKKNSEDA